MAIGRKVSRALGSLILKISDATRTFNIRYGFLTYAIISMVFRTSMAAVVYVFIESLHALNLPIQLEFLKLVMPGFAIIIVWFVLTSILHIVAIHGIRQRDSTLLYPQMVVLVIEILICIAISYFVYETSVQGCVGTAIAAAFDAYALACLINQFRRFNKTHSTILHSNMSKIV